MIGASGCPVCGHDRLRQDLVTARIEVSGCVRCGHRVAEHRATARDDVDYHRQYDDAGFIRSLESTRRAEARRILARIRAAGSEDALLDFGAGRGWFVEEARATGMRHVAGCDTSRDSVSYLRSTGVEALAIEPPEAGDWHPDLGALSFRPRVLTLLDVIEHFPPWRLAAMLSAIVGAAGPSLQFVVVKVPVAEGALYRAGRLLANVGVLAPIEQLYQVGTTPPHRSYFTRASLHALLERSGMRVIDELGLLDFDPASFGSRVAALRSAPRLISRSIGIGAAAIAALTCYDARVVLARPRRA